MVNKLKQLVMEEEGQGMTEYGLILGLIAIASIAAMTVFGKEIKALFEGLSGSLTPTSP